MDRQITKSQKQKIITIILIAVFIFFAGVTVGWMASKKITEDQANPTILELRSYLPKMTDPDQTPIYDASVRQPDDYSYHVLSVGNGEFTYVQKGDSIVVLDAGRGRPGRKVIEDLSVWRTTKVGWEYIVSDFNANGVKNVEAVFISHAHEDHTWFLRNLVNSYPVKNIILPATNNEDVQPQLIKDGFNGKFWEEFFPTYDFLGIEFENLTYYIDHEHLIDTTNTNNTSMVLRFQIYDKWFLFTGDIDQAEANLDDKILLQKLDDPTKPIYLYVLPHHGSSTSANEYFLNLIGNDIRYSIISGSYATEEWQSYGGGFEFPDKKTIDLLREKSNPKNEVYVTGMLPLKPLQSNHHFYEQVKGYERSYTFVISPEISQETNEYKSEFYTNPNTIVAFEKDEGAEN